MRGEAAQRWDDDVSAGEWDGARAGASVAGVVRVFPSADTTFLCVVVTLPPFLFTVSIVCASIRLTAIVSALGLVPLTGASFPSRLVV